MCRTASPRAIANTEERIRQTALDLFVLNGYQSTSLRDLAAHLGMQAGSLYNHIESKQSLLFDLMEEALDTLLADTLANIKRGKSREEKLRGFIQASVAFKRRERKRLALIHRETVNLSQDHRHHIQCMLDDYARCLESVIAVQPSPSTTDILRLDLLIKAIMGMLQGLDVWGTEGVAGNLREEVDQLTRMISGAISAAIP